MNNSQCPTCGRFPVRAATADAIVVKDNQILLVKRKIEPFNGYFALPGGFVSIDETTKDAALRELKEETGIIGISLKFFKFYDSPERTNHSVGFVYEVKVGDGELKTSHDNEIEEVKWFPLNSIPKLAFDHDIIMADFLRARSSVG